MIGRASQRAGGASTLAAMRLLLRLALALGLAALLALAALWWRLDALAERMIERGASEQLGVATEIQSLLLRPISGILSLRGLSIANPPGYAGSFLQVERARGEFDVATLRSEVIEVREISLSGVEVTLEEVRGGSNYDAIVSRLGASEPSESGAGAAGPSVRVRDLWVRKITAHVRVAPAPPLVLEIPEIHLQSLGGPGGASSGQITAEVVRAILTSVATEAPGVPLAVAGRLLTGLGLSGATQKLREAGERSLDAAKGALRELLGPR
jgi:hypothetical protein